jgi:hypothetical protein
MAALAAYTPTADSRQTGAIWTTCARCEKPRRPSDFKPADPVCRHCKRGDLLRSRHTQNTHAIKPDKADTPRERDLPPFTLPSERIEAAYAASGPLRHCPFCGEDKDVAHFARHPKVIGEYLPYCLRCKPAWNRARLTHAGEIPEFAPHVAGAGDMLQAAAMEKTEDDPPALPAARRAPPQEPAYQTGQHPEAGGSARAHKRTVTLRGGGSITLSISRANIWRLPPDALQLIASIQSAIADYEASCTMTTSAPSAKGA